MEKKTRVKLNGQESGYILLSFTSESAGTFRVDFDLAGQQSHTFKVEFTIREPICLGTINYFCESLEQIKLDIKDYIELRGQHEIVYLGQTQTKAFETPSIS